MCGVLVFAVNVTDGPVLVLHSAEGNTLQFLFFCYRCRDLGKSKADAAANNAQSDKSKNIKVRITQLFVFALQWSSVLAK